MTVLSSSGVFAVSSSSNRVDTVARARPVCPFPTCLSRIKNFSSIKSLCNHINSCHHFQPDMLSPVCEPIRNFLSQNESAWFCLDCQKAVATKQSSCCRRFRNEPQQIDSASISIVSSDYSSPQEVPLVIPIDVQNFKLVDCLDPTLFFTQLRLLNQPTIQSIPKKCRVPFVEEYNKLLLRVLENIQDLEAHARFQAFPKCVLCPAPQVARTARHQERVSRRDAQFKYTSDCLRTWSSGDLGIESLWLRLLSSTRQSFSRSNISNNNIRRCKKFASLGRFSDATKTLTISEGLTPCCC